MRVSAICSQVRWVHRGLFKLWCFHASVPYDCSGFETLWVVKVLRWPNPSMSGAHAIKEWIPYFMLDLNRLFSSFWDVVLCCTLFVLLIFKIHHLSLWKHAVILLQSQHKGQGFCRSYYFQDGLFPITPSNTSWDSALI